MVFTVGKRIGLSFAALLVLLLVCSGIGHWAVSSVSSRYSDDVVPEAQAANEASRLEAAVLRAAMFSHRFLAQGETRWQHKTAEELDRAERLANRLETGSSNPRVRDIARKIDGQITAYRAALQAIDESGQDHTQPAVTARQAADRALDQLVEAAAFVWYDADSRMIANVEEIHRTALHARWSLIAVTTVALTAGIILALLTARLVIRLLRRTTESLDEASLQLRDTAVQVSSMSQQLAEGAAEQASNLEETASAVAQMNASTRQNASSAQQVNEFMSNSRNNLATGEHCMADLEISMVAIQDGASQISQVIKVIEDISFQTNLLALNAAVEAARAGDHGKGFAVVADEVRSLAVRSAEAAKHTEGLIGETIKNTHDGADVARKTGDALRAIVGDANKVAELINDIATASHEQAEGVSQINTTVTHLDQLTQQNAANAEQSAAASEELSALADMVKSRVDEVLAVIGSPVHDHPATRRPSSSPPVSGDPPPRRSLEEAEQDIFKDF